MNTQQADFQPSGFLLGDGYGRFNLAMPWRDEIEELLATTLAKVLRRVRRPKILELGFGSGLTTIQLINHIPNAIITAVDSSSAMFDVAKRKVELSSVKLVHEDVLEFLSKSPHSAYDAVASGFMTHNLLPLDRSRLFDGIKIVVKNHGWFINADKYARNTPAKRIRDLAEQIVAFDVFKDDPDYRLRAIQHYLADDQIRFTEREQFAHMRSCRSKRGVNYRFIYRRRMEALFISRFTTKLF